MMNTMMNYDEAMNNNENFAVEIIVDNEMIKALENKFHVNCMALKNEIFGFGVWFTQSGIQGVYGDDSMRKAAISLYWDENAESIGQAFDSANTLDEAIEAANAVILGTIIDILNTPDESEAC